MYLLDGKTQMITAEYNEDDGFRITREEGTDYYIIGSAVGHYSTYGQGCEELNASGLSFEIQEIRDEDGEVVQIELTADEQELWEHYMTERLDAEARAYSEY